MSAWDLETWLKVAATIFQALSVGVAAYFAARGLRAWRRQLIGKRTVEVAEEALLAAYKVRAAISHIRSPAAFATPTWRSLTTRTRTSCRASALT